jgi:hypothetical protein
VVETPGARRHTDFEKVDLHHPTLGALPQEMKVWLDTKTKDILKLEEEMEKFSSLAEVDLLQCCGDSILHSLGTGTSRNATNRYLHPNTTISLITGKINASIAC